MFGFCQLTPARWQLRLSLDNETCHLGPVHTETFSCVFVLFQVMSWVVLDSLQNSKQYKSAGKRFRVYGGLSSQIDTPNLLQWARTTA